MKKLSFSFTLALAGALVLGISATAQEPAPGATPGGSAAPAPRPRRPPPSPDEMVKGMKEKLALTDEQADKVKAIIVKSQEHFMEVAQNAALSMDEKRTRIIAAQKAGIEEIGTVLTPEQSEKWKAELLKRQSPPSASAAAPAPAAPPAEKKP